MNFLTLTFFFLSSLSCDRMPFSGLTNFALCSRTRLNLLYWRLASGLAQTWSMCIEIQNVKAQGNWSIEDFTEGALDTVPESVGTFPENMKVVDSNQTTLSPAWHRSILIAFLIRWLEERENILPAVFSPARRAGCWHLEDQILGPLWNLQPDSLSHIRCCSCWH